MRTISFLLALWLPSTANAQFYDWTPADKALLAASTTLLVVDWMQTRYIAKNPDRYHELNPILGKHPSLTRTNVYFAGAIIGNYLLADYLGPTNRKLYLGGVIAVEGVVIMRNRSIGIRMSF